MHEPSLDSAELVAWCILKPLVPINLSTERRMDFRRTAKTQEVTIPGKWMQQSGRCMSKNARDLRSTTRRIIRGAVFDMDGTCTKACIDFKEMRRRAGILKGDILGTLDEMPSQEKAKALKAIEDVEAEALPKMQMMPGLHELCAQLDKEQIPRGMITRNSKFSVDHFHKSFFPEAAHFQPALDRDFKPYKPSPAALLNICKTWQIKPQECLMIGDSVKDDVVSGNRAEAITVLLDVDGNYDRDQHLRAEEMPSFVVNSLGQLAELLNTDLSMEPPNGAH